MSDQSTVAGGYCRLALRMPSPPPLAEYEPFRAVGDGTYAFLEVDDTSERGLAEVARRCQQAFATGATCGYSRLRQVKAVFFDMDATVIREESLVELARSVGLGAEVGRITERAMAGELDFAQALRQRVALLVGVSEAAVRQVAERLTPMPGIAEFLAFCREVAVPTFMVSGGFVPMAGPMAERLGFNAYRANVFGMRDGCLTGEVEGSIVDAEGKRRFLLETCAAHGFAPSEVAAVGDGANDLPMLKTAAVAVGHQPKSVLLPHLHAVNASGDHRFLAPLLFGRDISRRRH